MSSPKQPRANTDRFGAGSTSAEPAELQRLRARVAELEAELGRRSRQLARKELRQLRPLRAAVNALEEGVAVHDEQGRLLVLNDALVRLNGFGSEVRARHVWEELARGPGTFDLLDHLGRSVPFEDWPVCRARRFEPFDEVELTVLDRSSGRRWTMACRGIVLGGQGVARLFVMIVRDVTAMRRSERQQALLLGELNHRVKNMLMLVQSMGTQTMKHSRSTDEFRASFEARLAALSRAHVQLSRSGWQGAPLRELVAQALRPHLSAGGGRRTEIGGPEVLFGPRAMFSLAMVLHELATNAVRHGSLSRPEGVLRVFWSPEGAPEPRQLAIDWRESGGPAVEAPARRGFGLVVIEQQLRHELGATTALHFDPEGLRCRIVLPWDDELAVLYPDR